MSERKIITMFTWNGKDYTVNVNAEKYKKAVKDYGSVEAVYEILTEILYKQRDKDTGELKYPELTPRPEITAADKEADNRWLSQRMRDPNFAGWHGGALGEDRELTPSQMRIKEWEDKYPGAKEFYDSMIRYGTVQGATYGLGEDVGLQDDVRAFKYFAHRHPGIAAGSEIVGSIPTGFGLSGAVRTGVKQLGKRFPNLWPTSKFNYEPIPKSASAGQKLGRIMRNMGLASAETMLHMFGWRFGHTMPYDREDPFTASRAKEALVGENALQDYMFAAGFGAGIPLTQSAWSGIKNVKANLGRRAGSQEGAYDLLVQRASEVWEDALPFFTSQGISEDAMWAALNQQAAKTGGSLPEAVIQTQKNIIDVLENRGAPAYQDLPLNRILGEATKKAPVEATVALKDRLASLSLMNERMKGGLLEAGGVQTPSGGSLLTDPEGSANVIIKDYKNRAKFAYDEMADPDDIITRDVVADFINPGELGENARGFIDQAWDDTIAELDKILGTKSGRKQYVKEYGRLPRTLLPRDQFLSSSDAVLDPLVAQMIAQNARKYGTFSSDVTRPGGAATFRETSTVNAEVNDFNKAIGDVIPGYRIGNKNHADAKFIEDTLAKSKKMTGAMEETGEGYDAFNQWLKEWETLNGSSVSEDVRDNALRIFLGRTALDFIPPTATPRQIIDSEEARTRIRAFIGNEDEYYRFMTKLVDEQVSKEITESLPAYANQLKAGGTTGIEAAQMSPSLGESLPHTAAMLAFSPAFAGGRLGAQRMQKYKGMESEAVSKEALRVMLSPDTNVRKKFVADLHAGIERLKTPIDIGAARGTALGPPVIMGDDFDTYGMPDRDRKKELEAIQAHLRGTGTRPIWQGLIQ